MDSLADAMKAVELDPSVAKYYYRCALACEAAKDLQQAEKYMEGALERDPHNTDLKRKLRVIKTQLAARKSRYESFCGVS